MQNEIWYFFFISEYFLTLKSWIIAITEDRIFFFFVELTQYWMLKPWENLRKPFATISHCPAFSKSLPIPWFTTQSNLNSIDEVTEDTSDGQLVIHLPEEIIFIHIRVFYLWLWCFWTSDLHKAEAVVDCVIVHDSYALLDAHYPPNHTEQLSSYIDVCSFDDTDHTDPPWESSTTIISPKKGTRLDCRLCMPINCNDPVCVC